MVKHQSGKKPRVLLLSDTGSPHTYRWATSLAERGLDILVVGLNSGWEEWYQSQNVRVEHLGVRRSLTQASQVLLKPFHYLAALPRLNRILAAFQPDILHAHYASSYGLLGALSHFHPYVLSVWGTDVFDFPKQSRVQRKILEFNFRLADTIAVTSQALAKEVCSYTSKSPWITPFGVDVTLFSPGSTEPDPMEKELTVGIVKTLEPNYGIHNLVEAFILLASKYSTLRLLIVGDGSQRSSLQHQIDEAGLAARTRIEPAVPHHMVPHYLHQMDIFVVPSRKESFGVAALEASACGLPVIASRVGGLPEVVVDGETGFLIPPDDIDALVRTLSTLIESCELRTDMGMKGREYVARRYSWEKSLEIMESLYASCVL